LTGEKLVAIFACPRIPRPAPALASTPTWRGVKLLKFITPDIRRGVKTRSAPRRRGREHRWCGDGSGEEVRGRADDAETESREPRAERRHGRDTVEEMSEKREVGVDHAGAGRGVVERSGLSKWSNRICGLVLHALCYSPGAKQETPLPWHAARGWILNMHCFPVQCRIHIHVVRVFVSARVYYVRRTAGEGDSAGSQGRAWARVRARTRTRARWENGVGTRLCPENGRTMRPYWIIPTSLARVERPVRISIKNFKLQARFRARAGTVCPCWPHAERQPSLTNTLTNTMPCTTHRRV